MNKILLLFFVLCVLALTSAAQVTPDFQTVKTAKGLLVLNNNAAQPFTLLVPGGNPTASQNNDGSLQISTDFNGLVVYFVKTKEFLGTKKITDESEILKAHRDWDIAAQETLWKAKLNVAAGELSLLTIYNPPNNPIPGKNIATLYWSYPSPNATNTNQTYFQTVLVGDLVLMIGTGFDDTVKVEQIRDIFKTVFETLTLLPVQKNIPAKKVIKPKKKKV